MTALLSLTLDPNTPDDGRRLEQGLQQLRAEDPSLDVQTDPKTGQVVIGGRGELHLEIVVDRLAREFLVHATVGKLRVAYKGALTRPADGEVRYAQQQADGRGQYAHAKVRVHPGEPGTGYVFQNELGGGALPKAFIKSIDEGIRDALSHGVLAGYPIDDVRVELSGGSYHDLDSSETAFRIAGSMAFQHAAKEAKPVLLEPVMRVEVRAPLEHMGDVTGDLSRRHGQIQSKEDRGGTQVVAALVPLSEMFGYAASLRSRTGGRGTYAMQLERYEPCPEPGDDGRDSLVGAPRRPAPTLRDSSVALPEPEDDRPGDAA